MSLVCFDTNIVIWGIKEESSPGQEKMINKAKYLIQKCEAENTRILIPAMVIAELLSGTDPEKQDDFIRLMHQRFIVAPFDVAAAVHYAKIWRAKNQERSDLVKELEITREILKADCLVIATAVARNATCIYTYDLGLSNFAKGFIDIRELPEVPPTQLPLREQGK